MKRLPKRLAQKLINHSDCVCDDGKSCDFCHALISLDKHAAWELKKNGKLVQIGNTILRHKSEIKLKAKKIDVTQFCNGGHSWYRIRINSAIKFLIINSRITDFSYVSKNLKYIFLEEDNDWPTILKELDQQKIKVNIKTRHINGALQKNTRQALNRYSYIFLISKNNYGDK